MRNWIRRVRHRETLRPPTNSGAENRRTLFVIGGSAVKVVITVGVLAWLLAPVSSRSQLVVTGWGFDRYLDQLHASEAAPDGDYTTSVAVHHIFVTVRNDGAVRSTISGAHVDVLYAERLDDCAPSDAETGVVSPDYSIKLPTPLPPTPFTVDQSLDFPVEAGSSTRFELSIGPDKWPADYIGPFMIVAKLFLTSSESSTALNVGTAGFLSQSDSGDMLSRWSGWDCIERNADRISKFNSFPSAHTDDVDYLTDAAVGLLWDDPQLTREHCRQWRQSATLPKLCAWRGTGHLEVTVNLGRTPVENQTVVVIHLFSADTDVRYRLVAQFIRREHVTWPPAARPGWICQGLETDEVKREGLDENMRGVVTVFDAKAQSLTISVAGPPFDIGFAESLDVSAELKMLIPGPGDATTVGATPTDEKLSVPRG
ncbi:hypothetical protein [Nocardia terpenica]|uniref:Uncharacterized protein n=1 Tax=Nocardia terpenica TaxID=455432 RepID=A0A6G9Z613_9NOCA|nr:hypothetical protein [Nocardia terpenica]QIS20596.1 hypothetical protein F6W96_22165 [Nocardia terpenica]